MLKGVHEDSCGGHFGVEKSLGKLKERFYWPGHFGVLHVVSVWLESQEDQRGRHLCSP